MSEDLNSVEEEIATPEPVANESIEGQPEAEVESPAVNKASDEQDRNWRAMRERQREMEMAMKQKDEMLNRLLENQRQPAPAPVEEEPEIPDDDYAPVGAVKKIARKSMQPLEKKIDDLEKKLATQEQEKFISGFKTKYPDFDDVVNVETLELLEKKEPELAATIAAMNDPYKMGLQSYKFIKALGLVAEVPTARRVKEVDKKLEANGKTVQSPQAFDKRPMAQAFKTTAADQKRIYEEMMHYAAQANGF